MTATLVHREDPTGRELKTMFRGTVYIDFPWTTAKRMHHFPNVEYLECLPTLRGTVSASASLALVDAAPLDGRDIPTYAALYQAALMGECATRGALNQFLRSLDASLQMLCMSSTEQVRRALRPEYVVDVLLAYQVSRRQHSLPPKRKAIMVRAPPHPLRPCSFSFLL
jgi:hypothetical protein